MKPHEAHTQTTHTYRQPQSALDSGQVSEASTGAYITKHSHNKHVLNVTGKGSPDSAHAHIPQQGSDVSRASHTTRDAKNSPAYNHVYTSSSRHCRYNNLLIISLTVIIIYWYRH